MAKARLSLFYFCLSFLRIMRLYSKPRAQSLNTTSNKHVNSDHNDGNDHTRHETRCDAVCRSCYLLGMEPQTFSNEVKKNKGLAHCSLQGPWKHGQIIDLARLWYPNFLCCLGQFTGIRLALTSWLPILLSLKVKNILKYIIGQSRCFFETRRKIAIFPWIRWIIINVDLQRC